MVEQEPQAKNIAPKPKEIETAVEDPEFTLKRGRKSKSDEDGTHAYLGQSADESDLDIIDASVATELEDGGKPKKGKYTDVGLEESKRLKKARRKEAREKKKAAKAEQQPASNQEEAQSADEEEPFDYATAQSVLHARRAKGNNEKPATKIFDPYARLTDGAPAAAKQLNYEKAGKTATFKK